MNTVLTLQLVAMAALLALSAFFSSSETSLFSLTRRQLDQMRKDRNPRIDLIERLLSEPRRLIVTILIGNEFVNVAASVLSATVLIELFGAERKWLNLFVMVPVLLVVGEITPKTLAIRNNVAFAGFQARYLDLFAQAILPVRWTVRRVADYFTTLITGSDRAPASIVTEDMVRSLTREAVAEGVLDADEARYIEHVFDFGAVTLREVMTPRSQIFSLAASLSLSEMAREVCRTRRTKVPVYAENSDAIIGVLFARDLIGVPLGGSSPEDDRHTLSRLLHKAYFVPESKPAADLFQTLRRRRISLAFTVDEYGGLTGLVTMEDLLELIFGDIPSRSDALEPGLSDFSAAGPGQYRVSGATLLSHLCERLEVELAGARAETVGGLLLDELGELPTPGARAVIDGMEFTVTDVADRRIQEVSVRVLSDPPQSAPPNDPDDPAKRG